MKSQQLIRDNVHNPETLSAVFAAFDAAWLELESGYTANATARDAARVRLAYIILSLAADYTRDAQRMKKEALLAMSRPSV